MIAGALLDEVSDKAIQLIRSGQARTPEEATDLAFRICCSDGRCDPGLGNFLTDVWNTLTGKPQSWYTNVSNIQNHLSVVLAGVTAIGSDAWSVAAELAPSPIDDYGTVTSAIQAAITSIIVTQNHVPDDGTIASAAQLANTYDAQLAVASAASAPDVQAQVQSDQATVSSELPGPMTSPAAVGQQVFADELEKRAVALGQGIGDVVKYLAYAAGAAFGIYALSKMGGSRAA